jgi:hypothetical protein
MVVKQLIEPDLDPIFLADSYGYRPRKSALDAIGVTRERCRKFNWVLEFDIKGLFDNIDHELLLRAVRKHVKCTWALLYIERWLKAPMEFVDGTRVERTRGTPQGSVVSPILANLFMHYTFDLWMARTFPELPWCRYADDGLVHCRVEHEAERVKAALHVYIVHCVDTEGPLDEQPLGLDYEPPRSIDEDFGEGLVATIAAHRQRVLGRWEDIFQMLKRATSEEFRNRTCDCQDRGWIYNWFCMDHVGAIENPRQRTMGIHNIFDVYHRLMDQQKAGDAIHWHFHPTSTYHQAHRCATSYINSPELWEILCRRLIDRAYFPVANRAGFQDERPDSHWFLEQWIPFDFSNLAGGTIDIVANPDMVDGRFNDWRFAPADWSTYHPSHDSYQLPGSCRRKIARCLNVLSRFANINEEEMDKAFRRASDGCPTLVAFSSHDWRDLTSEVNYIRYLIAESSKKYVVSVKFCEAVEAFNAVHPEPRAGH